VLVWARVEPLIEVKMSVTPGNGVPSVHLVTFPWIILELEEKEQFNLSGGFELFVYFMMDVSEVKDDALLFTIVELSRVPSTFSVAETMPQVKKNAKTNIKDIPILFLFFLKLIIQITN